MQKTKNTDYEDAWGEGESDQPLVDAVTQAGVDARKAMHDEYARAHDDLDAAGDADPADPGDPDEDPAGDGADEVEQRVTDAAPAKHKGAAA